MKNAADFPQLNDSTQELRMITKAVAFLALLTGILYLRVVVGESLAAQTAGEPLTEILLLLAFLIIATAGLVVARWWDGAGGLTALLGGIGLAVIDYSILGRNQWYGAVFYGSPFVISGILCLVCWWRQRAYA